MEHGRLPWLEVDELNDDQRELHSAILSSPRNAGRRRIPLADDRGRLHGPFNAMLFNPEVGNALQGFGSKVRYSTTLSPRSREIAILEVARYHKSNVQWVSHAEAGRIVGLTEGELASIKAGKIVPGLGPDEAVVQELVRSLLSERDIPDALFGQAEKILGDVQVMDVVMIVGYYELLALLLAASRTPLQAGLEPAFA